MKIYFACSIRGGRQDADMYEHIVQYIMPRCTLLTEIFADKQLTSEGMDKPSETIWRTDTGWIKEADAIIAEVTNPSFGVGYEIAKAEEWGKPVLALFRDDGERRLSAMIEGSPHTKVVVYKTARDAELAIDAFLNASANASLAS